MRGHQVPLTPDTEDAIGPWRKVMRWRSGVRVKVKRMYNKRVRRYAKQDDRQKTAD